MRIEHWRYAVPLWIRGVFRRREVERELADEIRDHVEHQTAANMAAGMTFPEARRAALAAFGGVERIKDESRDARRLSFVDNLGQLRHAVRSLRRARAFTFATIGSIALAVAAGSTLYTVVDAVLLRPLPYPESGRLVGVWNTFPALGMPLVRQAAGTFDAFRRFARSFQSIGVFTDGTAAVTSADGALPPERVQVSGVSGSVLPMLGTRPVIGRVLREADEGTGTTRVAVISERYWRTRLGATRAVLGRQLLIEGIPCEIVGVVPETFAFPSSETRIWLVATVRPDVYLGNFSLRVIGRLRPGVTLQGAERELESILQRTPELFPEQRPGVSTASALAQTRAHVVLRPLRQDAIGGFERVVWLVGAIAGLLVLVAFSNVASLTLARIEARQRELAVRATLGASRARLWWHLVAEAGMVSCAGGLLGSAIAIAAIALLSRLGATSMPDPLFSNGGTFMLPRLDEVHSGWPLALCAVALTAAFTLLGAGIGAWRLTTSHTVRALREDGRGGTAGRATHRLRGAFVAAEVALSLVLLSSSIVLGRSLQRLFAVRPGFDPTNVFTTWTSVPERNYPSVEDVARFYRNALARVERIPGVLAAGVVSKPPLQFGQSQRLVWVQDAPPAAGVIPPVHPWVAASQGYFRAMGIPVIAGRVFGDDRVRRGAEEVVVSRAFAIQYWADSSGARAVGRRIRPDAAGPWLSIVGVVGDVHDTSLAAPPQPGIYLPEEPGADSASDTRAVRNMAFVVRTSGHFSGIAAAVDREIRALDPNLPTYDPELMTSTVSTAGTRMRFVLLLLGVGAAVALTLGAVGLYGVIAYAVGLRTREIGIRIALGLVPARAARMILGEGELLIAAGAAVGLVVFYGFAQLLRSLAYGVSVLDAASIAAAIVFVVGVATLATWIPARRAAGIDPGEALRAD